MYRIVRATPKSAASSASSSAVISVQPVVFSSCSTLAFNSNTESTENGPLMLGDILGEVFSAIIGDALLGWLWPNRPKQPWPPPEGQWNASLGSVAGFLGGLSVLFVVTVSIVVAQGRQGDDVVLFVMLGVGLLSAVLGAALARRTYLVSSRRHQFAAIGLWCSRASIALGIVTTVVLLNRAGLQAR